MAIGTPSELENRMRYEKTTQVEKSQKFYMPPHRLFCLARIRKLFPFLSSKMKKTLFVAWACAINVRSTNTTASGVALELGYEWTKAAN